MFNPKGETSWLTSAPSPQRKTVSPASLRTLTLNVKVKLVPNDKGDTENAPTSTRKRLATVGAAWKKTSEAGREYLSVSIDDPSFPATVYARLIENEDARTT